MRPHAPIRVLFYSHDSYGLGHLRRSLTIASALVQRHPSASALVVTGSPVPDLMAAPPRCEIVKLPSITKGDGGRYHSRNLPLGLRDVVEMRTSLLQAALQSFRPHLWLVDHAPAGVGGELLPVLRRLRHEGAQVRTVVGLRDVIDAPHRVRAQLAAEHTVDVLRTCYDEVLVYGSRLLLDHAAEHELPRDVAAKLRYMGIVCREPEACAHGDETKNDAPHVVATAGGGEDGYDLLRAVMAAVRGPLRERRLTLDVVAGPLMPEPDRRALQLARQGDRRIRVLAATDDMPALLRRAALVVGMAGYNSVYEALRWRRRVLVLPRQRPRQEQLERATRLQRLGLLDVMTPQDAQDPARVAARLHDALLREPPRDRPEVHLNGAARTAEHLLASIAARHGSTRQQQARLA